MPYKKLPNHFIVEMMYVYLIVNLMNSIPRKEGGEHKLLSPGEIQFSRQAW